MVHAFRTGLRHFVDEIKSDRTRLERVYESAQKILRFSSQAEIEGIFVDYQQALSEIKAGRKRSHWMWYIFPQFDGLGFSTTSKRYSIKSIAEAEAYLNHPVLGARLTECAEATLGVDRMSAHAMFGSPDDMKLGSCATLFAYISPAGSVFDRMLDRFFEGERDRKTLRLLGIVPEDK